MKNVILRMNYAHLRNEVHVTFHETANTLVVRFSPDTLGVREKYDIYKPLFDEEVSLLDTIKKSGYTGAIEEQDSRRDIIFRGFVDAVKSATNHFNLEKREAAARVSLVAEHYGNIAAKSFDEETAAIDDLLRELRSGDYTETVAALALNDWLTQLDTENQRFKELILARYEETAKRPILNMKATRTKVDKAFLDIVYQIEALVLVNGITAYEPFIKELNAVIERYKNILARHKSGTKTEN
jgi:hypothetical protein